MCPNIGAKCERTRGMCVSVCVSVNDEEERKPGFNYQWYLTPAGQTVSFGMCAFQCPWGLAGT